MVYLKSVENVLTLGKLIGLLFLFCLPLLSILFLKTKRNDLARPVMGTIFLVYVGMCVMYVSTNMTSTSTESTIVGNIPNPQVLLQLPLTKDPSL